MTRRSGSARHLPEEQLLRLALGWLPVREVESAVLHLVSCSECCRSAARSEHPEVRQWMEDTVAEVLPYLPAEHRLEAGEFLPLLVLPPERRRQRALLLGPKQRRRYFEFALRLSRSFWHSDGAAAHSLALDACALAEADGARPGARIRAGAFLVNALRVQVRLRESLRVLQCLEEQVDLGEPLDQAWLHFIATATYRDVREFQRCHTAADEAIRRFTALGRSIEAGEVRVLLGEALIEEGRWKKAERVLENLLRDPGFCEAATSSTLEMTLHNWVYSIALQGRGFEAEALRRDFGANQLDRAGEQPYFRLRRRWLDALILQTMHQGTRARQIFREVRKAFLLEGQVYDAAQVALDLAFLAVKNRQYGEGARLAHEIAPIFQVHGTHREAWMALRLLATSLREQTASLQQILDVADCLQADRVAALLGGGD